MSGITTSLGLIGKFAQEHDCMISKGTQKLQEADATKYPELASICSIRQMVLVQPTSLQREAEPSVQLVNEIYAQIKANTEQAQFFDPKKLSIASLSDFELTEKIVQGTGSGKCSIYRSTDGIEYVMKKNNFFEFYAGTLFQLMLGERSARVLFTENGSDFYAGSQFEPSYQEIHGYYCNNNNIPKTDIEGLGLIVVASFILGEIDLKGLSAANSNVGIKTYNKREIYFKIDHEQTFVLGGKYWQKEYIIDENLKNKLRSYAGRCRFNFVTDEHLEKAVQQIVSIPLTTVEETCDFCENQLKRYPGILKMKIDSSSEGLFFGLPGATTIKEAVLARFQSLQKYASC